MREIRFALLAALIACEPAASPTPPKSAPPVLPAPPTASASGSVATAAPPPVAKPRCAEPEASRFRDDGQALSVACDPSHVAVLDAKAQVHRLALPTVAPLADATWEDTAIELAWSPDGMLLAVLRADGVRLWSVARGAWALLETDAPQVLPTNGDALAGVAFHPTRPLIAVFPRTRINRVIANTPPAGGISIYDTSTGKRIAHLPDDGHLQHATWHPNGDLLIVGGGTMSSGNLWSWADEHLRVWSLNTQRLLRTLPGHTLHLSESGQLAVIERDHRRQGGRDANGYETTGAHVDLRATGGWSLLGSAPGTLAGKSDDARQLTLDEAVRGSSYLHWRVGAGRPKPVLTSADSVRIVHDTHDQFLVSQGQTTMLHQLGKPPHQVAPLGFVRRAGDRLIQHSLGFRSRDELLYSLTSNRTLHIDAAMVDGTCRLAVEERTTGAFTGDRAAIERSRACAPSDATPNQTPNLLTSVNTLE